MSKKLLITALACVGLILSGFAAKSAQSITNINVTLLNGDVNGDNAVEDQDYSLMGAAWYTGVGDAKYNVNADLNGDGFVEDQDYSIMGLTWYQTGDE
jgi:hypothetical protein